MFLLPTKSRFGGLKSCPLDQINFLSNYFLDHLKTMLDASHASAPRLEHACELDMWAPPWLTWWLRGYYSQLSKKMVKWIGSMLSHLPLQKVMRDSLMEMRDSLTDQTISVFLSFLNMAKSLLFCSQKWEFGDWLIQNWIQNCIWSMDPFLQKCQIAKTLDHKKKTSPK